MKFDVTLLPHQKQGKYWRGTYKVKSGDTLSKIAKEHHTTISALLALNPNIKSPHEIYQNENIDIVEGNADAIIKLDENMTVKVPHIRKREQFLLIERVNQQVLLHKQIQQIKLQNQRLGRLNYNHL